jgi:PAS domain S-box-containing protein/putative nucleotidyltransferase with HDIG domain
MSVPVMEGERVRLIFAVGNKPVDYEEQDVDQLQLIANELNKIIMQRRAEQTIKESEEQYRLLAQNSTDVIYTTDMNQRFTYASPAVENFLGYTVDEILLMNVEEILTPHSFERQLKLLKHDLKKISKSEDVFNRMELELVRKDGHKIWGEANARFLCDKDRQPVGILGVCRDITERRQAEEELQKGLKKLQKSLEAIASSLASAVEIRDPYTAGHQERVTKLACAIATEMGLSDDQGDGVRIASSLHDIGKIGVPAEVLSKPVTLTDCEVSMIKSHPQTGYEILKDIEFPWPVGQIVLQHHERMDGSGYPQGLKGEEILLEARILAVADVVEAMVSHRPYHAALGIEAALDELSRNKGILYDHEVVDACLKLLIEKRLQFE